MIYISYYTQLTPYEEVIKTHLIPSLNKWSLKYEIKSIKDRGSWQKNTHYKAEFIKEMLLKYKQSVVFLDADAIIKNYPILFDTLNFEQEVDIALHYLDWYLLWRKQEGNKKIETLSGTLYLNYNKKVLRFLDDWIKENKISMNWEQRNMEKVLKTWKNKLNIYNLPPEYICIIMRNGSIPDWYIKGEPIIIHYQASRKYKNK